MMLQNLKNRRQKGGIDYKAKRGSLNSETRWKAQWPLMSKGALGNEGRSRIEALIPIAVVTTNT